MRISTSLSEFTFFVQHLHEKCRELDNFHLVEVTQIREAKSEGPVKSAHQCKFI